MIKTPTRDQENLLKILKNWWRNKDIRPIFSYTGAAGTGKTTVIEMFIEDIGLKYEEVRACAYTGKATMVLLQHGLNASTIHSLIYNVFFQTMIEEVKPGELEDVTKFIFKLKPKLDDEIKLIIVDEATMVNDKMVKEIISFGIPTIFIGDPNQLPAIFGVSTILNRPDFTLHQIMRQNEGNPIIELSQKILRGEPLKIGTYGNSKVTNSLPFNNKLVEDYDVIICGKKKTREKINKHIREDILGIRSNIPIENEKLICRQNVWSRCILGYVYLTNGLVGYIDSLDKSTLSEGYIKADFYPDFLTDVCFHNVQIDYNYLNANINERDHYGLKGFYKFEYAYALNCHLTEGSTYKTVLYVMEKFPNKDITKKLHYTAITRASDRITIIL